MKNLLGLMTLDHAIKVRILASQPTPLLPVSPDDPDDRCG
jgi:hypothetical protein